MEIKKAKDKFNVYNIQLSYGELMAILECAKASPGAVNDEIAANIEWYIGHAELPKPGEEEEPKGSEGGDKPTKKDGDGDGDDADIDALLPDPGESTPSMGGGGGSRFSGGSAPDIDLGDIEGLDDADANLDTDGLGDDALAEIDDDAAAADSAEITDDVEPGIEPEVEGIGPDDAVEGEDEDDVDLNPNA